MSDLGRKDLSTQLGEKITPDSQKSTLDQTKETITGAADKATAAVVPEGEKSTTQKLGDETRGTTNDASAQGKTLLDQAQETVANAAQSVADALKK
ncbi:uncharacterized protein BDZ99DRAFT_462662 [Mytilinidion resinicola]|uniref:Chaperone/heat shock protein-like protein Hsp12 n=1 Tax=Mytilinidion resinicola TaxID=574789 RepID=A0A6A6YME7_9PEZI|nr:uncharacterized protein BDZ99DRAFT_462662 [Mytilinidion resinicola]KAF2810052.1 hypothetical protein BDZ99DRAFT_462662 [Mytilinidion resinicola]